MGAKFSKKTGETTQVLQIPGNLDYKAELSSYEDECRLDPDLQSFDATLQERTNRVISSFVVGMEVRAHSIDSLKEITGYMHEMNQEVVRIFFDCKQDIWNTQELFELVEEYFENC